MRSVLKIKNGKIKANLNLSYNLKVLGRSYLPFRYMGNNKEKPKSLYASQIIDLRFQYQPFCHDEPDFNPNINEVVDMEEGGKSVRDFIYRWHFSHRHGFPF